MTRPEFGRTRVAPTLSTRGPRAHSPVLALTIGLCLLGAVLVMASASRARDAAADELLLNGSFDSWTAGFPTDWGIADGVVTESPGSPRGGSAARMEGGAVLFQAAVTTAGAKYHASAWVLLEGPTGSVSLTLEFYTSSNVPTGGPMIVDSNTTAVFTMIDTGVVEAPSNSVYVRLTLRAAAGGSPALVEDVSLEDLPDPTPTPTPTLTATPTATPTPTATATSTTAATATRTPTVAARPTVALPAPRVRPARIADPGQLLANGQFEQLDGETALFWDNFGGVFGAAERSPGGPRTATLISVTDSTKWLFQPLDVTAGAWYAGSAEGRIASGRGMVFIRLSWYSGPEGDGELIESNDGSESASAEWTVLAVGPAQAPPGAVSATFRLMLRPSEAASAEFDDAVLRLVGAPAAATPTSPATASTPTPTVSPAILTAPAATSPSTGPPVVVPLPPRTGFRASVCARLCLSEVLSDPIEAGRDTPFEWVELENRSDSPVDLEGWSIGDANSLDLLTAYVVAPGGFVVVAAKRAVVRDDVPVRRLADGEIGSGLNNDGDTVRLVAPDGTVADAVTYGLDEPGAADAPRAGESLVWNAARQTWTRASEPSPGEANAGIDTPESGPAALAAARAPISEEPESSVLPFVVLAVAMGAGLFALSPAYSKARTTVRRWRGGR